jgi:ferrous iron transport protein A
MRWRPVSPASPESVSQPTTLADARPGFRGTISDLRGDEATCVHLLETGFTPGQVVTFAAASPLGDPIAFVVRGTILALRRSEARCVLVNH